LGPLITKKTRIPSPATPDAGLADALEKGTLQGPPVDTDSDGSPDFLDLDSDAVPPAPSTLNLAL